MEADPSEQGLACQGLSGLRAHYSILCLNDDKEILKSEEQDEQDLAEMISESSPYLVLIPKTSSAILMSASSQYRCLCLLKDAKKLSKAPKLGAEGAAREELADGADLLSALRVRRLSWLYPMARITSDWFVRSLNLMNLEKLYRMRKSVEVTTMDRVLCDEIKHLNLRELPSYFSCATGLLSALDHQLETGSKRNDLLDAAWSFGRADSEDAPPLSPEAQDVITGVRANLAGQSC